jgi:hypothetical protein
MRLHTANGSYCTHVATYSKQELLHTWGYTLTNRSYCTHAVTHSTTPPFNFYCAKRASQVSKDRITWSNWNTSISTSSAFWLFQLYVYIQQTSLFTTIHCTEMLWTYTVPNCCRHTLCWAVVDIRCTELLCAYPVPKCCGHCTKMLWTYTVPNCCGHTLHRNVVDIYCAELLTYTVPNCCGHVLHRTVADIYCTELLWIYTVLNCCVHCTELLWK